MSRIKNLQDLFPRFKIDYLLIDNPIDVFYLTGMKFSRARLLIGKNEKLLFLDGRYFDTAKDKFPCEMLSEKKLKDFIEKGSIRLGFNSLYTNYHQYASLKKLFSDNITLVSINNPLKDLRMVKDINEITLLKESAKINQSAFEYIQTEFREGISEKELVVLIEIYFLTHGAEKKAFDPIVCFSENGAYPHHIPSDRKLVKGDSILIDMGCVFKGYHSDMTRVVYYKEPHKEIVKLLDLVKEAQLMAVNMVKPGITVGQLDERVNEFFHEKGVEKYLRHRLGHGVGLEIHESPSLSSEGEEKNIILKPQMVFTIEPGLYYEGVGGVRYEDTVMVTQDGVENFYLSQ